MLLALALGSAPVGDIARAQGFLLRTQNPNGSWPVFPGDENDGGWVTSLAVALSDLVPAISARLQGIHWVLNCAGKNRIGSGNGSSVLPIAAFVSTQKNMAGRGSPILSVGLFPPHSRSLL